jgi:hypothetical protein
VSDEPRTILTRLLVPVGILYLAYLASQPPPARWVGLVCLLIVAPLAVGWVLGRVAGIGPWADGETD